MIQKKYKEQETALSHIVGEISSESKITKTHLFGAQKGLTDMQLVRKYEHGAIDLQKPIKAMLKTPSNSSVLKDKKNE